MTEALPKKTVPFQQVLDALVDESEIFPAIYLHRFSDLTGNDLKALQAIWEQVPEERRASLVEDLEELYDSDTLVSFEELARLALSDTQARVRAGALRLLWDYQGKDLISVYRLLLENDPDEIVRALAASLLGQYIFLGELEQFPASLLHSIEEILLQTVESGEAKLVRRRALESLGFSSRDEVHSLIQNAFDSGDFQWMASALFAMGRSSDEDWAPIVLDMLDHHEHDIQVEAIRAAGALELNHARKPLLQMVKMGIDDADLRSVVAWSLSQIGGDQVDAALKKMLKKAEDDEEVEFIQTAIDNLEFQEGLENFEMIDFSPSRRDDLTVISEPQGNDDEDDDLDFDAETDEDDEKAEDDE